MKINSKEVVLKFELPGFKREDINVKLSKGSVLIKAKNKNRSRVQRKDFFHQEKSCRFFNYSTTLPRINPKKATIEFKKGVLKITVPKE